VSGDEQRRGEGNANKSKSLSAQAGSRAEAGRFPTLDERRYSRALGGGLAILSCFKPERPVFGTTEIAELIGMSVTSTSRFVMTLVDEGFLERAQASRKYQLTLRATELGLASLNETGLCGYARPHLESLAKRTRYTVALGVLDGPEVLLLDLLPSTRRGQREHLRDVRAGSGLPAYCTAIGKLLLAHVPAEDLVRLIAAIAPELGAPPTPHTILTTEQLARELVSVAAGGFAVDREESAAGSVAIAAPVRDEVGDVVAAVSLIALGGVIELEELTHRFLGELVASTERISAALGYLRAGE
jgi:IclR family pca regulon transcriptional regulator